MNRQINYIIYAFLFLVIAGSGYWLLHKLSGTNINYTESTATIPETQSTILSGTAAKGKTLFMSKCASCHAIFKNMTGPGINGFLERGPWVNRKNVYEWIRNPTAFMEKNEYARELKKVYNSMMTGFPDLTNEEIDAICEYIRQAEKVQYSMPLAER